MKAPIALILILAAGLASAAFAQETATATLKGYDVSLIKLETPVTRSDEAGKKTLEQVYLVRLRGEFPVNGAKPMDLYIGDKRVGEYGSWAGGIYFIVLDKASLDAYAGKEFGWRLGTKAAKSLGVKFEPSKFDLSKPVPEKEAIAKP